MSFTMPLKISLHSHIFGHIIDCTLMFSPRFIFYHLIGTIWNIVCAFQNLSPMAIKTVATSLENNNPNLPFFCLVIPLLFILAYSLILFYQNRGNLRFFDSLEEKEFVTQDSQTSFHLFTFKILQHHDCMPGQS